MRLLIILLPLIFNYQLYSSSSYHRTHWDYSYDDYYYRYRWGVVCNNREG